MSLSIEAEGYPSDERTPIQWQRIIDLNRWLAHAYGIPVDGDHIVAHARFDHINRAHCPSTPSLDAHSYMAKVVMAIRAAL